MFGRSLYLLIDVTTILQPSGFTSLTVLTSLLRRRFFTAKDEESQTAHTRRNEVPWTACSLLARQSVCDGGLPLWDTQPAAIPATPAPGITPRRTAGCLGQSGSRLHAVQGLPSWDIQHVARLEGGQATVKRGKFSYTFPALK